MGFQPQNPMGGDFKPSSSTHLAPAGPKPNVPPQSQKGQEQLSRIKAKSITYLGNLQRLGFSHPSPGKGGATSSVPTQTLPREVGPLLSSSKTSLSWNKEQRVFGAILGSAHPTRTRQGWKMNLPGGRSFGLQGRLCSLGVNPALSQAQTGLGFAPGNWDPPWL